MVLAAQVGNGQEATPPVLLQADEVTYDSELGVVTAQGDVEISQGERVLRADVVTYNERTEIIAASGNVVLLEPTGEIIFAEYVELTDDMKEGFMRGFRMLLEDDSRLAAAGGRRTGGVRSELRNAVYSPCKLCEEDPTRPPLWQIKAVKVVHDAKTKDIVYRHAWLEIFGVPVAYTPYLRHPDPTVERRSGFLAPVLGASSDLGSTLQIPYFWAISPDKDVTIDPILTSEEGVVMSAEYRQRFTDGEVEGRASGTLAERKDANRDKRFRGHLDTMARFSIDDTWRWGADIKAATDDTYLKRYGLSSEDTLTSHAFAEGFRTRNYALGELYFFQGLRTIDNQEEIPVVAPKLDYNFVGEPSRFGGRAELDVNLQALTRDIGADSRRLSVTAGWEQPRYGRLGDILTLKATVQGDLYHVNDVSVPNEPDDATGFTGRIFPQASLEWRYPWARAAGRTRQLIEPIASVVVAPNGGNPDDIPNEDSRVFEFDDTNLFSPSRFPGKDLVEGGQRFNYGIRLGVFGAEGGAASAFIGQSYRLRQDATFETDSGLENDFSDVVGRIDISAPEYLDLIYRFRLNVDDLVARRNEVQLRAGPSVFQVDMNYVFFDTVGENVEFSDREEVFARLSSSFANYWSASVNTRRDLGDDGGTLSFGASLGYKDECIIANLEFKRTFTSDRDVPPTDAVLLRVTLKHLGQLQQQVF